MTRNSLSRVAWLSGACLLALASPPLSARQDDDGAQGESTDRSGEAAPGAIIVSAERLRGQLDVEQAPILELGEEDIAAEGVTSIADLITQITDQAGSARGRGGGGRPVILINGIRVGSFREFSNYPPEALERLEVFPEEVAQRFGFPPDRRVINLILKDNYRNAEVELEFEGAARGGYARREQELGFLQIADGARINVSLEASDTTPFTEDERPIVQTASSISDIAGDPDQAPFRSLSADSRSLEGNVSWAKALIDSGISLSANANYQRDDSLSLEGLNTVVLTGPAGDSVLRTYGEESPLTQRTARDTFSTSGSLTSPVNAFRLTATYDASLAETTQQIDRRFDGSAFQADAASGALALDGPLPSFVDGGFDTAFSRTMNASTLATLRGPLAQLPGGELIATFDTGYDWTRFESEDTRSALPLELTRGDLTGGANFVIPITSRRNGFADALGSFTLTAQAGVQHLSDFGTLGDYTLGLTWSPIDDLDLSATRIYREVAPGLNALGAPRVETLNEPVFDFTTGDTVLATVISGGNPDLLAESQQDWKFAANWRLPFARRARFTLEYVRNRSEDVTSSFPQVSEAIEAAFPGRVIRDGSGQLIAIDRRPVTFAETRAERLSFGLSLRGSIGGGNERGRRSAASTPARSAQPARPEAQPTNGDNARGEGRRAPPSAGQRAAFQQFRARICADDGLDVLMRLAEAAASGEDLSATIPGFDARRFERLLARVRGEDGAIDPQRLARVRERICSFNPASAGEGQGGEAGSGERRSRPRGAGFAAFREIACGADGEARIRALVARIDAGEDVSDELPGFDPARAGRMIDRLRGDDGEISSARIARLRERMCAPDGADWGQQTAGEARGGPPAGFNPLARRSFRGFRYFISLNHQVELANSVLIAPGLAPLDLLEGEGTGAFGLPRHTSRLEAGIFGAGVGMRASARYTGEARIAGSSADGSGDLFFGDIATLNLRVFGDLGQLAGSEEGLLRNMRVSLRLDNVFDAQRSITEADGDTPVTYQPFLVDPVGRYVGIELRKLF
ncbi:hypothetical protein [Qipengyuania nanhaisediminis]|uniref:hypothetical protein n=1 Tax=Qipengyuania nanhaisediminis TaxID=604088 RepID=UPI0038B23AFC